MTKEEIALMLSIPKLQPLDALVSSRVDRAVLLALQLAHKRYPDFELANANKALWNLENINSPNLRQFFERKKKKATALIEYNRTKSDINALFEQYYTDYSGKCIANYINDILMFLVDCGSLNNSEVNEYIHLINDDSYDD
jgi:hypothetical protein